VPSGACGICTRLANRSSSILRGPVLRCGRNDEGGRNFSVESGEDRSICPLKSFAERFSMEKRKRPSQTVDRSHHRVELSNEPLASISAAGASRSAPRLTSSVLALGRYLGERQRQKEKPAQSDSRSTLPPAPSPASCLSAFPVQLIARPKCPQVLRTGDSNTQ
jgi:hypothetical protein